jgi:CheY-like chemotaxis protein
MATVLLIEDDADQLEIRRLLVERAGHVVQAASSPSQALSCLTPPPAVAVMDLSLPAAADGLALIRQLHDRSPGTRIAVLTGWPADLWGTPEESIVSAVIEKPCRTAELLSVIARLALCLLLLLSPAFSREFPFSATGTAETIAELDLRASGADWAQKGREAAVARLRVDEREPFHVIVFGDRRVPYRVFLGRLTAGPHRLVVERDSGLSAGVPLEVNGVQFKEDHSAAVRHAPVLSLREDTIGRFSDVPLLVYAETLAGGGLEYTTIFSNEDGGHSTTGLMARWGRTTDIEYVYRHLASGGIIQGPGHDDVPFRGPFTDGHPQLITITENNMLGPGAGSLRLHPVPVETSLGGHSREVMMDRYPWTYAIASQELIREGRVKEIRDPRNYLYIEARISNRQSRLAFKARLTTEAAWRYSHRGDLRLAIERSGWVRAAIELPEGVSPRQIAEFSYDCLPEKEGVKPVCHIDELAPGFFLTPDYAPGRPFRLNLTHPPEPPRSKK